MRIVNANGQIVLTRTINANTNNTVDFTSYPKGVYFVQIQHNDEIIIHKIVKLK